MPTLSTAKNILKNIKSETAALNKTLRNRIDAAKVAENGILNYETKALEKTTVGEAAGAFKAVTGEGPSVLGDAVKQAEFEKSLALDSSISKKLYDSTPLELHVDPAVKEALAEPISRPANVISRQSGSRVPGRQMQRSSIEGQASTYSQSHGDAFSSRTTGPAPNEVEEVVNNAEEVSQIPINRGTSNTPSVDSDKITYDTRGRTPQRGPRRGEALSPSTTYQQTHGDAYTYTSSAPTPEPTPVPEPAPKPTPVSEPIVNADVTATAPQASAPPPPPPPQAQVPQANKPYAADASTAGTVTAPATVAANAEKGTTLPAVAQEKAKGTAPDTSQSDEVVSNSSWARSATMVMGGVLGGAALTAALSSNRGQQTNAQLYGQQPLY